MKAWVGIDPGKTGAAVLLTAEKIHFHDWQSIDRAALTLQNWSNSFFELKVALEKVHTIPGDGRVGAFRFGENFGIWQGILAGLYVDYILITPQEWQNAILKGIHRKIKGANTKSAALKIALELYPAAKPFLLLKKHSGRVDALLIATLIRQRGF